MSAWIYQLNPESGATFLDRRKEVPTSLENLFRLEIDSGGVSNWYVRQHFKEAQRGDLVFVKMGGSKPLGVVAMGRIDKKGQQGGEKRIWIRFDREASHRLREKPVPPGWLKARGLSAMANLVDARSEEVALLRAAGGSSGLVALETEADSDAGALYGVSLSSEGHRKLQSHYRVERSKSNRDQVLASRSRPYACEACGLRFQQRFGPEFRDLIHVHHKIMVASGSRRPRTKDFALLCPNCHALAHWQRPLKPRSISELKRLVAPSYSQR